MRRHLSSLSLILLAIWGLILIPNYVLAAVSGACSNCHTMHNSYQGRPMASYSNGTPKATPNEMLLKLDCIGCHMTTSGQTNPTTGAPAVYHTNNPGNTGPGKTLAGGDFYWVAQGDDRKGHNVAGIAKPDATFSYTPPGWDPNATQGYTQRGQIANGATTWTQQLSCWGTYGCHGTNSGLKGHHQDITGPISNATTVATSYRFLYGIKGYESSDWEWGATSSNHNEYFGYNFGAANADYNHKDTISYLCAECHGQFYKDRHSGSAWLRHPTDYVLPNSGEYANYNNGGGYSLASPVARPAVPTSPSSTVTPGDASSATGAIVMCLSCHRAHGSEYPSILRWDYSSTSQAGCKVCHTQK